MKILIVDDEPLVRRALARAFLASKHEVEQAENGEIGISLWRSHNPDVVLLDVIMPGLTGPQVLEEMGQTSTIVVLMSAFAGEHNVNAGGDHSVAMFLEKPFSDVFEVVNEVEELFKSCQVNNK